MVELECQVCHKLSELTTLCSCGQELCFECAEIVKGDYVNSRCPSCNQVIFR